MFSLYEAYISRRDHIYQYTELSQKRNIRLLHIEHSGFTIVERSLDNLPPFEALSYVWGDPNQPHELYLADGSGSIPLTESLHQAIRHLPCHLETSYIWIDQLCINQQDTTERGHQVSLMGEIFGAAQRVLAWLGPETERILPFSEILEYRENNTEESQEKFLQAVESLNDDPKSDLSTRRLLGMQQFFGPWFMRVWILQESALASKILLFVGRKSFSWDTIFSTAMRLVKHPEMRVLIHHWQGREIWSRRHLLKTTKEQGLSFCQLLSSVSRHLKASDPRDKAIANLGFWKPPSLETHDVYNDEMTPTKLFLRISRRIIKDTESLDILGSGYGPNRPLNSEQTYPLSWVPDWSKRLVGHFSIVCDSNVNVDRDSCSQRRHVYYTTFQGFEDPHLKTKGRVVDHVKATSSHILPSLVISIDESRLKELFSNLYEHLKTETPFANLHIGRILQTIWNASSHGQELKFCPNGIANSLEIDEVVSKNSVDVRTFFNSQWGRKFMMTTTGKIGLVVEACTPGDAVVVLHGSRVPLILRKCEGSERFQLVGDCYVDGIMFGEAVDWSEEEADNIVLE